MGNLTPVNMHHEIIMAGAGGQGIMIMGQLLAYAAVMEDRNVVWIPSYGPETRGGPSDCTVIISDDEVGSPVAESPDALVAMNQLLLDKYKPRVKREGLILVNSSITNLPEDRSDCNVVGIAANDVAMEIGNARSANMVMLGAFAALTNSVALQSLKDALPEVIPPHRHSLLQINERALEQGASMMLSKV